MMADFGIGEVGTTFILVANTIAAKELCVKHLPEDFRKAQNEKDVYVFPFNRGDLIGPFARRIIDSGLTMIDRPKRRRSRIEITSPRHFVL